MALGTTERSRLSASGSSGVSDAMERPGLPRAGIIGFGCAAPDGTVVVGPAFTIRQVPKHFAATRDQRPVRHGEASRDLAQPGDFIVVDAGGRRDIAGWGENHSARCLARGVSGVLVHGAAHDSAGSRRIGFAVFHPGCAPVASRWDQETAEIGGAVVVGGASGRAGRPSARVSAGAPDELHRFRLFSGGAGRDEIGHRFR